MRHNTNDFYHNYSFTFFFLSFSPSFTLFPPPQKKKKKNLIFFQLSFLYLLSIDHTGNTGCSPVYLIPANSMPMVQQPFYIVNPSTTTATDLTSIQQLQQANILASNPSLAGASLVSNPATGGYLLVSPGSAGTAANFSMPLVNLASTTSVNSSQPVIPSKKISCFSLSLFLSLFLPLSLHVCARDLLLTLFCVHFSYIVQYHTGDEQSLFSAIQI